MTEIPEARRKMFRRKKKLEGRDIEMEFEGRHVKVTKKDKGMFCRSCGTWKSWNKIDFQYGTCVKGLTRSMICECGDFLKEELL